MKQDDLKAIFASVVAAAHPDRVLPAFLPEPPDGDVIVLGAGKAGASMAAAAERFYRERHGLGANRLRGMAVTRDGYRVDAGLVEVVEAGHPVPNAAGMAAARAVLELATSAGEGDLVLALLSGGGSANWLVPLGDITLADKQAVTRALLKSGAGIGEINCVRKHISAIKGGRLAAACRRAKLVSLAISDVPGDDPSVIASGPTVPDPTTRAEALAVIARYRIELPPAVRAVLEDPANETPKPGDPAFAGNRFEIVSTPRSALQAGAEAAERLGWRPVMLGADIEGEARDVARAQAQLALDAKARGERVAIISGGELTVTIRGEGRGGPNQEFALALAIALGGAEGIAAMSADTDGTDGGTGLASDPAGAFVRPDTLAKARALGIDPAACLLDNDSTGFFEAVGDIFRPGPTHTNVNDCRVILVDGEAA